MGRGVIHQYLDISQGGFIAPPDISVVSTQPTVNQRRLLFAVFASCLRRCLKVIETSRNQDM